MPGTDWPDMQTDPSGDELPLFPLRSVLFPGGLLSLKVFEARYLDLMSTCLRERKPFGVVALRSGDEARKPGPGREAVTLESVGVWAELLDTLNLRGDERILDLGCGRGAVLLMAAQHLTTGRAVGRVPVQGARGDA